MHCRKRFSRKKIHKSGFCRECLDELRVMYKDVKIPFLEPNEEKKDKWKKRELQQKGVWNKPMLITKVYKKWRWYKSDVRSGWYYKIGKKEFGIYESEREAQVSLLLRLKSYS